MKRRDIQKLIDQFLDGELSPEEKRTLENELRNSELAREMFKTSSEAASMLIEWGEEEALREQFNQSRKEEVEPDRKIVHLFPRTLKWGLSLAACALVALSGTWFFRDQMGGEYIARLSYDSQSVWNVDLNAPKRGKFTKGTYHLKSGFARFDTEAGAVVSVSGPAKFTFIESDVVDVEFGKFTARLGTDEASLKMLTKSMDIRDLGTAFGLHVESNGEASVSVFEGAVEVKKDEHSLQFATISEGKTLKSHFDTSFDEQQESSNPEKYNDLWPLTLGLNSYSNLVRLFPPGPVNRPLHEIQSSSEIFLLPEKQGVYLEMPVDVDLSQAGKSWPETEQRSQIRAGTTVDSFVMYFNPLKNSDEWQHRVSGEVRFDKRVIGVICNMEQLTQTDELLGLDGVDYSSPYADGGRGLEAKDVVDFGYFVLANDVISISEDQHQLYFNFNATTLIDQVRILVAD